MKLAKLRSISSEIWYDEKFTSLSNEQKLLLLYFNTTEFLESDGTCVIDFTVMPLQLGFHPLTFKNALLSLLENADSFIELDTTLNCEIAILNPMRVRLVSSLFEATLQYYERP